MQRIQPSDLIRLVKVAEPSLLDWTVGFVKAVERAGAGAEETVDAVLAGTGVLVTANGRHAILTANHVLQNLPKAGPTGLILLSKSGGMDHQFMLEMDYMQKVTVGQGSNEGLGPDLALIVLPRNDVSRLEVWKSFYNLSKRKNRMLERNPTKEKGFWVLCGLIGEMTQEMPPLPGMARNFAFKGLCGPVVVPGMRNDEQFDYCTVEVNCGQPYDLPESFGGCSGCGLWRLVLREDAGSWRLDDLLLGGIAFYESAVHEGRRNIECHGCKSIYSNAEESLAGRG
jgi:hypothetical protein